MRFLLICGLSVVATACDTLENRRDLYNPDTYFYPGRAATTTTVRKTTTTTTNGPVEFRPHGDHGWERLAGEKQTALRRTACSI
ncbi:MAG: hypothetical protein M3N12_05615 [Verrucomicrobiota bacterium]|nr:hypothetical protein [Verrucomicrobiota bacterium]